MTDNLAKELRDYAMRDFNHNYHIERLKTERDALRAALREAWDRGYLKAKVTSDYDLEERVYALLDGGTNE